MNELIDELVADLDERTRVALEGRAHETAIHLYGSRESRYLKGIAGKAKKFCVPVRWFDCPPPLHPEEPFIADTESIPEEYCVCIPGDRTLDLDCIGQEGLSCTAEACMYILRALRAVEGKHVCIIGRGHAVKKMATRLVYCDATVTVCHSKTENLREIVMGADVLVNSAPKLHPYYDVGFKLGRVLLDISGGLHDWKDSNLITYIGSQDIGRLNTSLVLNRFATR